MTLPYFDYITLDGINETNVRKLMAILVYKYGLNRYVACSFDKNPSKWISNHPGIRIDSSGYFVGSNYGGKRTVSWQAVLRTTPIL